jgi:hypothetical protein
MASGNCLESPITLGSCSGNGFCNNESICVCSSNLFTGRSDWVNAEGKDCQIVLPIIWAFWAANLLEILAVIIIAFPILLRLWRHHKRVRENQRQKGHRYTLRENLGLLSTLPFWLVALPAHTAVAVSKLADRDSRLGLDLFITILWVLSRIFADLSTFSARAALTISTMQSEGASPRAIFKRELLIWAIFLVSAGSAFLIWPVYATSGLNKPLAEGLFAAHFVLASIISCFNAFISHGLGKSVNSSLQESYEKLKDERILQVRDDLVGNQHLERNVSLFLSLCYLSLGAIPFLWITHDYFWCILWLIWPYLGLKSVTMLDSAQKSARGDKERDRLIAALQTTGGGEHTSTPRRGSVTSPSNLAVLKESVSSRFGFGFGSSSGKHLVANSSTNE